MGGYRFLACLMVSLCSLFLLSCSGSSTQIEPEQINPSSELTTGGNTLEQSADSDVPSVNNLPRVTTEVGQYLDMDRPISFGPNYREGKLMINSDAPRDWVTLRADGYRAAAAPSVLKINDLETSCDTYWVGVADFSRGCWRWLQGTTKSNKHNETAHQDVFLLPQGGRYFRLDGAAFITIVIDGNTESTEDDYLQFTSARLATSTGVFYQTNFKIENEADLDSITSYSSIDGNLVIDCRSFENLAALERLQHVGGDLTLAYATETHLLGLTNLATVGGIINFGASTESTGYVFELSSLEYAGGIESPSTITRISGIKLPSLTEVGYINLKGNDTFNQLSLPVLTVINGDFSLECPGITESGRDALYVPKLVTTGDLHVDNLGASLLILPKLQQAQDIIVSNCEELVTIEAPLLGSLHSIHLLDLPKFMTFDCQELTELRKVDDQWPTIELNGLNRLLTLDFLSRVEEQSLQQLKIMDCGHLTHLDYLDWIYAIDECIIVRDLALWNFSALDGTYLGHDLYIEHTSIHEIPAFTGIENGYLDTINIKHNRFLTDISALSGLEMIKETLWIEDNPLLTSLNGLESIQHVSFQLRLNDNDSLVNLDPLASLIYVYSDDIWEHKATLEIADNDSLVDISALQGLLPYPNYGFVIYGHCMITNNALTGGDADAWALINSWGGTDSLLYEPVVEDNG